MVHNDNIDSTFNPFSFKFIKKSFWNKEEDKRLIEAYEKNNGKNWKKISEIVETKTSIQCLHRWSKVLSKRDTKGLWTKDEDRRLKVFVQIHGDKDFSNIGNFILNRSTKQCRERWFNVLHPKLKKGDWTLEEDYLIFKLFTLYGGKWIYFIPLFKQKRSENSLKNRFYSTIRRFNTEIKKNKISVSSENEKVNMLIERFEQKLMTKYNFSSKEDLRTLNEEAYSLNKILSSYNNPREIFFEKQENEPIVEIFKVEKTISFAEINQISNLCQYFGCNINTLDKIILPKLMSFKPDEFNNN